MNLADLLLTKAALKAFWYCLENVCSGFSGPNSRDKDNGRSCICKVFASFWTVCGVSWVHSKRVCLVSKLFGISLQIWQVCAFVKITMILRVWHGNTWWGFLIICLNLIRKNQILPGKVLWRIWNHRKSKTKLRRILKVFKLSRKVKKALYWRFFEKVWQVYQRNWLNLKAY